MDKLYLINNDLGTKMLLIGLKSDNGLFEPCISIEIKNTDMTLVVSKSSITGKENAQIFEETADAFNRCKNESSTEELVSLLEEKGYTEYKLEKNIFELWTKLSSLKSQA